MRAAPLIGWNRAEQNDMKRKRTKTRQITTTKCWPAVLGSNLKEIDGGC